MKSIRSHVAGLNLNLETVSKSEDPIKRLGRVDLLISLYKDPCFPLPKLLPLLLEVRELFCKINDDPPDRAMNLEFFLMMAFTLSNDPGGYSFGHICEDKGPFATFRSLEVGLILFKEK